MDRRPRSHFGGWGVLVRGGRGLGIGMGQGWGHGMLVRWCLDYDS
jgi:hypothetical protein